MKSPIKEDVRNFSGNSGNSGNRQRSFAYRKDDGDELRRGDDQRRGDQQRRGDGQRRGDDQRQGDNLRQGHYQHRGDCQRRRDDQRRGDYQRRGDQQRRYNGNSRDIGERRYHSDRHHNETRRQGEHDRRTEEHRSYERHRSHENRRDRMDRRSSPDGRRSANHSNYASRRSDNQRDYADRRQAESRHFNEKRRDKVERIPGQSRIVKMKASAPSYASMPLSAAAKVKQNGSSLKTNRLGRPINMKPSKFSQDPNSRTSLKLRNWNNPKRLTSAADIIVLSSDDEPACVPMKAKEDPKVDSQVVTDDVLRMRNLYALLETQRVKSNGGTFKSEMLQNESQIDTPKSAIPFAGVSDSIGKQLKEIPVSPLQSLRNPILSMGNVSSSRIRSTKKPKIWELPYRRTYNRVWEDSSSDDDEKVASPDKKMGDFVDMDQFFKAPLRSPFFKESNTVEWKEMFSSSTSTPSEVSRTPWAATNLKLPDAHWKINGPDRAIDAKPRDLKVYKDPTMESRTSLGLSNLNHLKRLCASPGDNEPIPRKKKMEFEPVGKRRNLTVDEPNLRQVEVKVEAKSVLASNSVSFGKNEKKVLPMFDFAALLPAAQMAVPVGDGQTSALFPVVPDVFAPSPMSTMDGMKSFKNESDVD